MFDQLDDYEMETALLGQSDPERSSKLDAERVTAEWRNKSTKRADCGKRPIEESPLFGGPLQEEMF